MKIFFSIAAILYSHTADIYCYGTTEKDNFIRHRKNVEENNRSLRETTAASIYHSLSYKPVCDCKSAQIIQPEEIPKFVHELFIPPVLFDDKGDSKYGIQISVRQIKQQILPYGFPETIVWAYGDPSDPETYHHPSGTIEVTQNRETEITWCNELVVDPEVCSCDPGNYEACKFLKHIIQDACGQTLIDQTLHWAAPNRECREGPPRINCAGSSAEEYDGPVPVLIHVHGAFTGSESDGYPEAWFLPKASNIPSGYAIHGGRFATNEQRKSTKLVCHGEKSSKHSSKKSKSSKASKLKSSKKKSKGKGKGKGKKKGKSKSSWYYDEYDDEDDGNYYSVQKLVSQDYRYGHVYEPKHTGCATFIYPNEQPTATLWYHDHSLGITRLNVYSTGAGFYLIRDKDGMESGLIAGKLPGPPPTKGKDPNSTEERKLIREVPLVIQDKTFYRNGKIWHPSSRAYFQELNEGTCRADNEGFDTTFLPDAGTETSPIWNPEVFFNTIVVNGNTWPKFTVAPERYRFRLVNACDSRFLNLVIKKGTSCDDPSAPDLPIYVIGGDQGLLPHVVKITTGFVQRLGVDYEPKPMSDDEHGLLVAPGERYDIIVDFSEGYGEEFIMCNFGAEGPFSSFPILEDEKSDPASTGTVMLFNIVYNYNGYYGDQSTPVDEIVLDNVNPGGIPRLAENHVARTRDVTLVEIESHDGEGEAYPVKALFGTDPNDIEAGLHWNECITENPGYYDVEIWNIYNLSADSHPIHLHLVKFEILSRENIHTVSTYANDKISLLHDKIANDHYHKHPFGTHVAPVGDLSVLGYEEGWKDTVIAYPGQITKIITRFSKKGLYLWHCHVLSHDNNEMMRPMCVGDCEHDCRATCCQ